MRRLLGVLSVALALAVCSASAWSQEGILTFSPEPAVLEISPGGRAAGHVAIENASPREADHIELTWTGSTEFALDPTPEGVAVLGANIVDVPSGTSLVMRLAPPSSGSLTLAAGITIKLRRAVAAPSDKAAVAA